jgi:hypothetical protein
MNVVEGADEETEMSKSRLIYKTLTWEGDFEIFHNIMCVCTVYHPFLSSTKKNDSSRVLYEY